jgi:hypothetical protein
MLLSEIANDAAELAEHASAGGIRQGAVELMFDAKALKAAHTTMAVLHRDVEDEITDRS